MTEIQKWSVSIEKGQVIVSVGKDDSVKRERIMGAAQKLFFQYGLKKTTVDEIAREAKVGKGTIYLYFKTKEELLAAISSELFSNLIDELRQQASEVEGITQKLKVVIYSYFTELFSSTKSYPHSQDLVPLYESCATQGECCSYADLVKELLQDAKERGEIKGLDVEIDRLAEGITFQLGAFSPPYSEDLTLELLQEELSLYISMLVNYLRT